MPPTASWLATTHLPFWTSVVVVLAAQFYILRAVPGAARALPRTALLLLLCGLLALAGLAGQAAGAPHAGEVLRELAMLAWGVLAIRLASVAAFRAMARVLRISRLMQDLLFVAACAAWALIRLRAAGLDMGGLITTSAVVTGIVAFSLQETLGNILGGLALQLDQSLRIGDWIQVDDVRGRVTDIHWRHTALLTTAGEIVQLPNSILMKSKVKILATADKPLLRRTVPFSATDGVPPQEVVALVEAMLRDAHLPGMAATPAPNCLVTGFRDGSTDYAVQYWTAEMQVAEATDSALRLRLYSCLHRHSGWLARPVMDIHVARDEAAARDLVREAQLARRVRALAATALFSALTEAELRVVAESLQELHLAGGEVIARQGSASDCMYVLLSGEAEVWHEQGGERRRLAMLGAGDVFGEMSLMSGEPRQATVTARADAACYRIDKAGFERVLSRRPELAGDLARIIAERSAMLDAVRSETARVGEAQTRILANIRRLFGLAAQS